MNAIDHQVQYYLRNQICCNVYTKVHTQCDHKIKNYIWDKLWDQSLREVYQHTIDILEENH